MISGRPGKLRLWVNSHANFPGTWSQVISSFPKKFCMKKWKIRKRYSLHSNFGGAHNYKNIEDLGVRTSLILGKRSETIPLKSLRSSCRNLGTFTSRIARRHISSSSILWFSRFKLPASHDSKIRWKCLRSPSIHCRVTRKENQPVLFGKD